LYDTGSKAPASEDASVQVKKYFFVPLILVISVIASFAQYSTKNQENADNVPYPHGLTSRRLPADISKHLIANSDKIAWTAITGEGSTTPSHWGNSFLATPGNNNYNVSSQYYGTADDPTYCVTSCREHPRNPDNDPVGHCFHAPSGAKFDGYPKNGDENLLVWDQTQDKMFNAYSSGETSPSLPPCKPGQRCQVTFNYCAWADRTRDPGYGHNPVYTNGLSPGAGNIRIQELIQGQINHALYLNAYCTNGQAVFPAPSGSTALPCSKRGVSNTNRPANGALFFLDYTTAQIDGMDISPWQKTILKAFSTYGAYLGDTGGAEDTLHISHFEAGQAHEHHNVENPLWKWLDQYCPGKSCEVSHRRYPGSNTVFTLNLLANIPPVNGTDVAHHMHIADPCVPKSLVGEEGGCIPPTKQERSKKKS
jgi:hypothetical protein